MDIIYDYYSTHPSDALPKTRTQIMAHATATPQKPGENNAFAKVDNYVSGEDHKTIYHTHDARGKD